MPAKLKLVTRSSSGENRTVPLRRPNAELRQREYLTEDEVEKIINAAKRNRYGQRDATMILTCYRHGLRASELCELRWSQIDWSRAHLHVKRLKGSDDSVHTIEGDEKRALRHLQREQEPKSPFVFTSERGAPFTPSGFAKMIERAGDLAKLGFKVHPHQLRHACGFALANKGVDTRRLQLWLGHKDIRNTAAYSKLSAQPFEGMWRS
jgi:type 1 fimbriae regulatory protein FimB/type 1 fimbriae regulatory protein FimE